MAKTNDSNGSNNNGRLFTTQQSLDSYVKSICDIMRRSNCAGALQYVPELTWILFLRILDELEASEQDELEAVGQDFKPSLGTPYRWREWAAPYDDDMFKQIDGLPQGWKRKELTDGAEGEFFKFLHTDLIPHLKALKTLPNASPRQKVISEILSSIDRTRIDTEKNFLDILDKVHAISQENIDTTHIFALSQVYEGLLLKMGEKGNDGGQFFTPRVVIRAMVKAIDPKIGETIYCPNDRRAIAAGSSPAKRLKPKTSTSKPLTPTRLRKKMTAPPPNCSISSKPRAKKSPPPWPS